MIFQEMNMIINKLDKTFRRFVHDCLGKCLARQLGLSFFEIWRPDKFA